MATSLARTRATAILRGLGVARPSAVSVGLLVAWQACEGGPATRHNPMNTTLRLRGVSSVSVNSEGVQQYPTEADGIRATVQTLENGLYPQIVGALRTGSASSFFAATAQMAKWGTSMACIRRTYGGAVTPAPTPTPARSPAAWVWAAAIGLPLLVLLVTD